MSISFRANLYHFIASYINEHHRSPVFAEMTTAMSISPRSKSLITRSLRQLEKEGKIELIKAGRHLLIRISSKEVALLGRISAGIPIEAIEEQEFLDFNQLFRGLNRFALKVKGSSMVDEGICEGDIIICQKTNEAKEGDIVVALIDQQNTTLKRISFKHAGMITLIPANPEFKPKIYSPEQIHIQGLYLGLIRIPC